jgi:hypothetical protein
MSDLNRLRPNSTIAGFNSMPTVSFIGALHHYHKKACIHEDSTMATPSPSVKRRTKSTKDTDNFLVTVG